MIIPKLLSISWASSGLKTDIPAQRTSTLSQGAATYEEGFPSITMTPIAQGGKAPSGRDMNGALYELSEHIVHLNKGGSYFFDADFAELINGYSKGAMLLSNDCRSVLISLVDNNKVNFNTTSYDQYWSVISTVNRASTSLFGLTKLNNTLTSTSTSEALTAAQGKYLEDKKLNLNGSVPMTGNLSVKSSDSSGIMLYNTGNGWSQIETRPESDTANIASIIRFNPNGAETHRVNIPTKSGTAALVSDIPTLSSSTNSTSTTQAATPSAVKAAYDVAIGKVSKSGDTMTGELVINSKDATVRFKREGVDYGYVGFTTSSDPTLRVGSNLYLPSFVEFSSGGVSSGTTFNAPRINITDGVIHIRGRNNSSVRTYNNAGEFIKWEVLSNADAYNFGTMTLADANGNNLYMTVLPKKNGIIAHTSDVEAVNATSVKSIRLGSHVKINLGTSPWASYAAGYVVTGFENGPGEFSWNDQVFVRPIQMFINGAWVTATTV